MGICASCLGLKSTADDDDDYEESRSLLANDQQSATNYGTSTNSPNTRPKYPEPLIPDIPPLLEQDETHETAEQNTLTNLWKDTSDRLIDISLVHTPSHHKDTNRQHRKSSTTSQNDSAYASASRNVNAIDYERLFRDTLPRKTIPAKGARPSIQHDTFTPPRTPDDGIDEVDVGEDNRPKGEVKSEQQWLREIINTDLKEDEADRRWDPNVVHKIGKPLLVNFDEVLNSGEESEVEGEGPEKGEESGAIKALRGVAA